MRVLRVVGYWSVGPWGPGEVGCNDGAEGSPVWGVGPAWVMGQRGVGRGFRLGLRGPLAVAGRG